MHPRLNLTMQDSHLDAINCIFVLTMIDEVCDQIVDRFGVDFLLEEFVPICSPLS